MKMRMPKRVEGVDSFLSIPDILQKEGAKKPLIVTGPRIGKSEFFQNFLHTMTMSYAVFDKTLPDPRLSQIEEMVQLYWDEGCDSFIAIGGGSNMDAAKAASARIARPDKTLQQLGGLMKVRKKTPLFIAVPTTAGTGSETTVAAVVTDDETSRKYAINDPALCPDYAVLDPTLTVSLPPSLTASTGMDALTHAIEAYLNKPYHTKDTAHLSEEAVRAIMEFLPKAYADGKDMEAREEMLAASFKAGVAFTTACVGNVHAIAHTIGGLYHVPHGLANAVVLPIVLEDYGEAAAAGLARLARLCELKPTDEDRKKAEEAYRSASAGKRRSASAKDDMLYASAMIRKIREMNQAMDIPETFPQIEDKDIDKMAGWAEREANPLYPVPVVYTKQHFARVIRKVKTGK